MRGDVNRQALVKVETTPDVSPSTVFTLMFTQTTMCICVYGEIETNIFSKYFRIDEISLVSINYENIKALYVMYLMSLFFLNHV